MSDFTDSWEYSAIVVKVSDFFYSITPNQIFHPFNIYPFIPSILRYRSVYRSFQSFQKYNLTKKNNISYSVNRRRRDRETVEGISERSEERKGGRAVSRPSLYLSFLHFIPFRSVIHSKLIYFTLFSFLRFARYIILSIYNGNSQVKKNESRFSQLSCTGNGTRTHTAITGQRIFLPL